MSEPTPKALIQIERCIIGALLTGIDISMVGSLISPEMILDPDNRTFFSIVQDLDDEGTAVTAITLAGRVAALKSGSDPMTYLSGCIHQIKKETTFVLENYCHEIRIAYASRRLVETCETSLKAVQKKKPISQIINSLEVDILEISNLQKRAVEENLKSIADISLQRMSDAYAGIADDGVPWGFDGLKTVADGNMQYGNFHALLFDSAGGKTSLSLQIMRFVAELGIPVLFVSYEQDSVQCIRQMSSQRLKIESKRMLMGKITEAEYQKIQDDHYLISDLPLEIVKASGWGAGEVAAAIKRFNRKRGKGLAVIDHAKSVVLGKESLFAEQINEVYKTIRDSLKSLDMAGLLLMQRKSSSIDRDNPEPIKRDAYGGDATSESLDLLVGMWRPEQVYKIKLASAKEYTPREGMSEKDKLNAKITQYEGKAKLLCLKNRYGNENARAELDWEPQFTSFSDVRANNTVNYETELF